MKFLELIDDRFDELLNRLEMLSNINTHTYNLLGLDSCIYPIKKMFEEFIESHRRMIKYHRKQILDIKRKMHTEPTIQYFDLEIKNES